MHQPFLGGCWPFFRSQSFLLLARQSERETEEERTAYPSTMAVCALLAPTPIPLSLPAFPPYHQSFLSCLSLFCLLLLLLLLSLSLSLMSLSHPLCFCLSSCAAWPEEAPEAHPCPQALDAEQDGRRVCEWILSLLPVLCALGMLVWLLSLSIYPFPDFARPPTLLVVVVDGVAK